MHSVMLRFVFVCWQIWVPLGLKWPLYSYSSVLLSWLGGNYLMITVKMKSHDCHGANEVTINNIGKIGMCQTITKCNKLRKVYVFLGMHCMWTTLITTTRVIMILKNTKRREKHSHLAFPFNFQISSYLTPEWNFGGIWWFRFIFKANPMNFDACSVTHPVTSHDVGKLFHKQVAGCHNPHMLKYGLGP